MEPPIKYCPNCGNPIEISIPEGDNREREVCPSCGRIHYRNPRPVVGCLAVRGDRVLLCRRSIEPRKGYWTVPAGFMELGETMEEGAKRETREEALAEVEIERLFAVVDVLQAGQVHFFYVGSLVGGYGVGAESSDARLFTENEIPWDEIAFPSGKFALRKFYAEGASDDRVHAHLARRLRIG